MFIVKENPVVVLVILHVVLNRKQTIQITLFRAGAFKAPFRFFLCHSQTLQDIQVILGDYSTIFSNYSLRTFHKICRVRSGQVRSPERAC